ncbi:MAG: NAD(P)-dependent oxidoreductase [Tepidisphaeraceae bacterium]
MSEKIYRDEDVNWDVLKGKVIAVLGYGIQGKAQAANAKDSGFNIIIGSGSGIAEAKKDGFEAFTIAEAVKKADIILIELADPVQPPIYKADIAPNLRPGQTLCFCHGFSVLYGQITPPKDVNTVLFVPNCAGQIRPRKIPQRRRRLRLRGRRSRRHRRRPGDRLRDLQSRRQHAGRRCGNDLPARNGRR